MKKLLLLYILASTLISCKEIRYNTPPSDSYNLTIFFVNDHHGQLENFSKIKYIVDQAEQETNVIVASAGDMFSGNPVVDQYPEKGYPMIDLMNKVGFDISVIGNHEFDYGEQELMERMEDSEFHWICANVDMSSSVIPEPLEYVTISIDSLDVTFLGLIETGGKPGEIIPATHPLKIENILFEKAENVISKYKNIKEQQEADLYIALTHLGQSGSGTFLSDFQLAEQMPELDLIIGGHSHRKIDTVINNVPVFSAISYLNYLGKIELEVKNKEVKSFEFELIDLNAYPDFDAETKTLIDNYNNEMAIVLDEVIGNSLQYHPKNAVGCFYTDAIQGRLSVDASFQNTGGVRNSLDEGEITKREVYEFDPFMNGTVIYNMSVSDIKNFLIGTGSGFYYAGIQLEQVDSEIVVKDTNGNILEDNTNLTIGINDYIPAVHDAYFPVNGDIQPFTTAEAIIYYLQTINDQVNYPEANCYFRYQ
ncbi:MAG: bifunctional UDP-sugar hydrolase/5'-nucleotidase [Bacteroidota bacterium]